VTIPKALSRSPAVPDSATAAAIERREIEVTPRQKLEQALTLRPTDVDLYEELAKLHLEEGRVTDAQRVLMKALAVSGNNYRIQDRLDDVQILRLQEQLLIAQRRAKDEQADSKQLVDQLTSELNRVELEVFGRRHQRHPNDPQIRFELGVRLKRLENYTEAAKLFQSLAENPQFSLTSAVELGECYQRLKQFGKAIQQYQGAIERATDPEQLELRKTCLYRTGILAAAMRDPFLARKVFESLVALDPSYKDARTHLDKLT